MTDHGWKKWEVIGLLLTLAAGNLLHFVYDWSGENMIVAAVSGVNESVWEHMKLLAMPWILWSVVEVIVLRRCRLPILSARTVGLLVGLLVIPLLYYSYTGATGINVSLIDIVIFQLAVLAAFGSSWFLLQRRWFCGLFWQLLGGIVLVGMLTLFVWWTYRTPQLPIFVDPATQQRGMEK